MKVLHVYRTFFPDPPGGLQEAIRQICLSCQRHGHDSRVFTLSPSPQPARVDTQHIHITRSRSWLSPASCDIGGPHAFKLFKALADWADIVHFHFPWPFLDFLNLTIPADKPRVMTYHSDIVRQRLIAKLYSPLMWKTLRSMGRIVATSPDYVLTSPVLSSKALRERVRVIPLGIEESSYLSGETESANKLRENAPLPPPYILFIGVLRYYKGLDLLLKAAQSLDAQLVIAGSGPEHHKLVAIRQRLKLQNVHLIGQVSEPEKISLLKNCCALILPSQMRSEAFGMSMIEASMFGKPLISCEIGSGTSFVNKHDESGLVTPANSPQALSEAMNRIVKDQQLAERLGAGARSRYEKLFSGEVLGQAYSSLYSELARNRHPASNA